MNYANPEDWKDNAASEGINISGDFFPVYGALHNAVVTDHFKVLARDMYNQVFDKVGDGDTFRDRFMILMTLIMEHHGISMYLMVKSGEHKLGLALT